MSILVAPGWGLIFTVWSFQIPTPVIFLIMESPTINIFFFFSVGSCLILFIVAKLLFFLGVLFDLVICWLLSRYYLIFFFFEFFLLAQSLKSTPHTFAEESVVDVWQNSKCYSVQKLSTAGRKSAEKLSTIGAGNLVLPLLPNSFDSHHGVTPPPHSLEGELIH